MGTDDGARSCESSLSSRLRMASYLFAVDSHIVFSLFFPRSVSLVSLNRRVTFVHRSRPARRRVVAGTPRLLLLSFLTYLSHLHRGSSIALPRTVRNVREKARFPSRNPLSPSSLVGSSHATTDRTSTSNLPRLLLRVLSQELPSTLLPLAAPLGSESRADSSLRSRPARPGPQGFQEDLELSRKVARSDACGPVIGRNDGHRIGARGGSHEERRVRHRQTRRSFPSRRPQRQGVPHGFYSPSLPPSKIESTDIYSLQRILGSQLPRSIHSCLLRFDRRHLHSLPFSRSLPYPADSSQHPEHVGSQRGARSEDVQPTRRVQRDEGSQLLRLVDVSFRSSDPNDSSSSEDILRRSFILVGSGGGRSEGRHSSSLSTSTKQPSILNGTVRFGLVTNAMGSSLDGYHSAPSSLSRLRQDPSDAGRRSTRSTRGTRRLFLHSLRPLLLFPSSSSVRQPTNRTHTSPIHQTKRHLPPLRTSLRPTSARGSQNWIDRRFLRLFLFLLLLQQLYLLPAMHMISHPSRQRPLLLWSRLPLLLSQDVQTLRSTRHSPPPSSPSSPTTPEQNHR